MSHPAENAVGALRQWAEASYEQVVPFDLMDMTPTMWGFGISHRGGLTLVWSDVTGNAPEEPWTVMLSGGVALDVPDPVGAVLWANDRNRQGVHGKYYCGLNTERNVAAVVFESHLTHLLFRQIFQGPHGPGTFAALSGYARGKLDLVVQSTADGGSDVTRTMGGYLFAPGAGGLTALIGLAGG